MYTSKEVQMVADVLEHMLHMPCSELEKRGGICANLAGFKSEALSIFQYYSVEAYHKWPHYSEDMYYPVPNQGDPKNALNKSSAFNAFHKHKYKSMWSGEYGNLRISLLVHLCTFFQDKAYRMRLYEATRQMQNPFPNGRIPVRDESPLTRMYN
jgi:hypothetical protein